MSRLIVERIALGFLTAFLVSVLIFVGTEILPGDLAEAVLGQSATPEALEAIRRSLGLHDPAYQRYLRWLAGFVTGDLGSSLTSGRPVAAELSVRLKNTFFLAAVAAAVAVPLALSIGIASAIWKDGWFDRIATVVCVTAISVPEFLIGYLLILFVALELGWFPSLSAVAVGAGFGERLNAVALPATTVVLAVLGYITQMTRASVLDIMSRPYIEMAYLKGLPTWRIVLVHALPNALAPIIQVVAFNLAYLVIGIVLVEVVFVYPGVGQYLVDAVSMRDVPVVQACGLIFGATYIGLNVLADLLVIFVNPRLRYPR